MTTNYYDPAEEKKYVPLVEASYLAHVTKVDINERSVRNKHRARVYNFYITVADEASSNTYSREGIDGNLEIIDGSVYVGRQVRSVGIFEFLSPDVGDSFEANPGGNKKFMEFAEALGVDCPGVEIEVDGEKRTVKTLPTLDRADIIGKPVHAIIGLGKPWKDRNGQERQTMEVKSITSWADGAFKDVEAEDLPF